MDNDVLQREAADAHVRFPLFRRLIVDDYGLYPGHKDERSVELGFQSGLTLVVGSNGLGKTTLVTMLYRLLTGGYELSLNTLNANELGGADLDYRRMKPKQRRLFAERVNDRAKDAWASLEFDIGAVRILVKRRLDNLGLISLHIDDQPAEADEGIFQTIVLRHSGLSAFGDWLLFLRQMVFYFEDRRSLVWDPSAQRQAFRMLFLPPDQSGKLYSQERDLLKLDSEVRNTSATIFRLQRGIAQEETAAQSQADVRAQINSLTPLQEDDLKEKAEKLAKMDSLDELRRGLRRDLLEAEEFASRIESELENARLRIVYSQFPDRAQTVKYLLSLLMADGKCAVCSSDSEESAQVFRDRVNEDCCVLCGAHINDPPDQQVLSIDHERLKRLRNELEHVTLRIAQLQAELAKSNNDYEEVSKRFRQLSQEIDDRRKTLDNLISSLPEEEEKQLRKKDELSYLKEQVVKDKERLRDLTAEFTEATEKFNLLVQGKAEAIKEAFAKYAQGFLFENVSLKWSYHSRRIGQLQRVETASFDLDMSGTNFQQAQRRDGPGSVSESQREFIDLAFRMALIEVAGEGSGGTLVIDAPESSLDAVFVERAADVLCRFGRATSPNRLIIASNLVDGRLLPRLIELGVPRGEESDRLINLLKIAVPTAAIVAEDGKYRDEWAAILRAAREAR